MSRRSLALALGSALGLLVPFTASATPDPIAPHPDRCAAIVPSALERFLDERLGGAVADGLTPGAVVVGVQNGRVIVAKGYGKADLASGAAVDPDRTVFFGGSQSKLITATAVMQLVDRGLVDLDTDINRYLRTLRVDSSYAPITLRHLLTHTGGIDMRDIGIVARRSEDLLSLREFLASAPLTRVEPPGTAFRYSNRGMALAGLVVEDVTGRPFADYVREHIFEPLGMHRSTMDSRRTVEHLAGSYVGSGGAWRSRDRVYMHNVPAVGLRTTAADMARFLLAHLNGGAVDGVRILSDSATAAMHAPQFAADPRMSGTGFAFRYARRFGMRVLGHRGLMNEHASILAMVQDRQAGWFVACNSVDCMSIEPVMEELLTTFLCGRAPHPDTRSAARPVMTASELAGVYRPRRHAIRNVEKARGLFDEFELGASADTLVVSSRDGRRVHEFVPVGRDEYALVGGDGRLLLLPGTAGGLSPFLGVHGLPEEELVRLPYVQTRAFFTRMTLASAAWLASAVVLLPVLLVARRLRRSPGARGIGLAAALNGAFVCALLLLFLFELHTVLSSPVERVFMFGMPDRVRLLLWLPVVALIAAVPLPVLALGLWRKAVWTVAERAHYTLMLASMAGLFLLLTHWNLLGPAR